MSAVELAIKKVKGLSARQARELVEWLDGRREKSVSVKHRSLVKPRENADQRKRALKAWQNSVRLTTDWEPPRMPDDLVKPFRS